MSYGSLYSGTASRLITLVSGSATVTFAGTVLTEEDIRALDTLYADGAVGKVKAIVDAATLELLRPWPGPNRSGYQAWDIARDAPARLDPVEAAAAMTQAYGFASLINGQTRVMRVESEGNAPPGAPLEGRYYLAGPAPSGWPLPVSAGDLVRLRGGTYGVITPETGWLVLIVATGQLKRFGGGAWSQVTAEPAVIRATGGNSARTILSTERDIALTAALTAARVWSLPAANAVPAGTAISVADEVGGVSSTNTLTLQRAGSDTIGAGTTVALDRPYQAVRLVSDGASRWTLVSQADDARKIGRAGDQMAGALAWAASVDIASAATTAIDGAASNLVRITGTTTITSFGSAPAGTWRQVLLAGALTLTHNATSLILPGGASIVTAAGDTLVAVSEGGSNWRVVSYTRAAARPAFRASGSGGDVVVGAGAVVQFGTVITNIGSGYNGATHKFTAPVAGLYAFAVGLFSNEVTNTERYYLSVNGGAVDGSYLAAIPPGSGIAMTGTALRALAAGDVVDVRASAGNGKLYGAHLSFAGWLIS